MSTHSAPEEFSPADWVSQAEAARIRGVSRQAIAKLVRRGRLRTLEIAGHTLVSRADVLNFTARRPGRPRTEDDEDADAGT